MRDTPLTDEESYVAAAYDMGEPIWMFRTLEKRERLKMWGGIFIICTLGTLLDILPRYGFGMDAEHLTGYVPVLIALIVFAVVILFLLMQATTTVYLCTAGIVVARASVWQAIRWEEVEFIHAGNTTTPCILVFKDPDRPPLTISHRVLGLQDLSEEITRQIEQARWPHPSANGEELEEHALHEPAPLLPSPSLCFSLFSEECSNHLPFHSKVAGAQQCPEFPALTLSP